MCSFLETIKAGYVLLLNNDTIDCVQHDNPVNNSSNREGANCSTQFPLFKPNIVYDQKFFQLIVYLKLNKLF